ncbi:MAG: polysaccharide biosynthesis C-terminal domain-containing protein [Acidobacteria bacterium]|nr:polysaccharide biosynthesis C-terminal domain-containing protein [Acidobacteriota bacterium]
MAVFWPLGIATAVIIGRWLGPAGKGEYTLAILGGTLLFTLLNLGIPSSISYFLSGQHAPETSLVKSVIVLAALLAAAALAVALLLDRTGWCAYLFGVARLSPTVWAVMVGLPFYFVGTFLQFVILAQGHRVLFAALPSAGAIIVFLFTGIFVLLGKLTPLFAVGAVVASQVFTGGALLVYEQLRVHWWGAPLLTRGIWKELASYSVVSHAGNILQFLVQRVDVFMVGVMLDVRAVGLYSVGYGVAELLLLLPQRLGTLYLPRMAAQDGSMGKAEEVRLSSSLVFVGTVIAAVFLSLIAPLGIRLLYGEAFAPSVAPFLLLLPGICAMATCCILAAYLAGVGKVKINTAIAAVGVVSNVLLNLVLIPRFGISGAAIASSLTYCTEAFLFIAAASRVTRARPISMLTSASPSLVVGVLKRAFR